MPVSSLTPLSLTASVNLYRLREALEDLEVNHGFFTDDGGWCCNTCAGSNAWNEGKNKPFVFWHEQNEDSLHTDKSFEMSLAYGIAIEGAKDGEIIEVAKTIISVLKNHDIPSKWDGDIDKSILVELGEHKPYLGGSDDPYEDEYDYDYMGVDLFIPLNNETKDYCLNECEDEYEPEGSYSFFQRIS